MVVGQTVLAAEKAVTPTVEAHHAELGIADVATVFLLPLLGGCGSSAAGGAGRGIIALRLLLLLLVVLVLG